MQISDLRHYLVHPLVDAAQRPDVYTAEKNLLFVRLETDEGLHGWGECYTQADRDTQIAAHLEQLKRYVLGRDPSQIKHFTEMAYNDFAARRGALDYYSAVSGIEQALWDLAGKRLGAPVHVLLGGACRERIRVYANGWARTSSHQELAARAREIVARGFTALKFEPRPRALALLHQPRPGAGSGPNGCAWCGRRWGRRWTCWWRSTAGSPPCTPVRLARALEPFQPFWYEEPVLAENLDALAAARRQITHPVVTGEALYTKFEFREVFEKQAADIINPDVCNVGGILELKEIGAMAEPYFVAVAPHNYNSTTVGLAATLQVSATMPNFLITEYFVNFESWGREVARPPLEVVDGYIALPDAPGLGIDLDEDALQRFPYQPYPPRALRTPRDEGP